MVRRTSFSARASNRKEGRVTCQSFSNVVTNGNGTGTKNVLKGTVSLGLSLVSSLLSTAQLL